MVYHKHDDNICKHLNIVPHAEHVESSIHNNEVSNPNFIKIVHINHNIQY